MLPRANRPTTPRWVKTLLLQHIPPWQGQLIAVACVVAAALARYSISPFFHSEVPFITFFPAVIAATVFAGPWPGLTALALSAVTADYFWFVPPLHFTLTTDAIIRLTVFCLLCGLLILSIALMRALIRTLVDSEERALILAHEMTHRARNVLGLIQAISRQTFQTAASLADYQTLFEARLIALGRAQELVIENPNFPTDLGLLLDRVLEPFDLARFRFDGANAGVPHEIGATLALLVHELGTNSLKYGALSVPEGTIDVTWANEGQRIRLDWRECGGPPVALPERSGFGSRLMQTAFPPGRGEAALAFAPQGVECRICFPTA